MTNDDSGPGVAEGYNSSQITDFGFFPNVPTPPPNNGGPIFQMEVSAAAAPDKERKSLDASFVNWVRGEGGGPLSKSRGVKVHVKASLHTGTIFPELLIAGLKFFRPNFLRWDPNETPRLLFGLLIAAWGYFYQLSPYGSQQIFLGSHAFQFGGPVQKGFLLFG